MSCRPQVGVSLRTLAILIVACLALLPALSAQPGSPPAAPAPKRFLPPADTLPLNKALEALAQQTGIRVEDRLGKPGQNVRLPPHPFPAWEALDRIAEAVGARVELQPSGPIALVAPGPKWRRPRVSYDGPFRFVVKGVRASLDLEGDASHYGATIEAAWEPGLLPLFLETRPQGLRVTDDKGNALPAPDPGSSVAPVDGRTSLTFDIALPALPRSAARIKSLEGTLTAVVPSKMLTFTFPTLDRLEKAAADAPERGQTQDGVSCRVGKVVLAKDRWTVQVSLDLPPGGKRLESYQSWVVNNEMVLQGKDGKTRLASSDYFLNSASSRRAVITYHFRDKGRPARGKPEDWRVVYRTPASIVEVPVKFSFKDVPLP
jgi:hypothetical protein